MNDTQTQLADRVAIQDNLARYVRGVDRRQWDMMQATYHDDAYDDHGDYKGDIPGYVSWLSKRHELYEGSTHFLGNCLIEFTDATHADVETYFVAYQRLGTKAADTRRFLLGPEAGGDADIVDVEVIGRYLDRVEKRNGQWKTAYRRVAFDMIKAQSGNNPQWLKPTWTLGSRDARDPVFAKNVGASRN